jgi:hypothetical protein
MAVRPGRVLQAAWVRAKILHRRDAETQSKTRVKKGAPDECGWRVFPGVVESAEEAESAEKISLNSLRLCVSAVTVCRLC